MSSPFQNHVESLSQTIIDAIQAYFGGEGLNSRQLPIAIGALVNVACVMHLKTGHPVRDLLDLVRGLHVPREAK